MVQVGNSVTYNEAEMKKRYPVEEGLIAGTTKQEGTELGLKAEASLVLQRNRVGI